MTVSARFDGRVFVPDEPVPIEPGRRFRLVLEPHSEPSDRMPTAEVIADRLRRLRSLAGCIHGPALPDEAFDRENLYDERA